MKLYKYSGTIEELAVERGRISYIKLFDVTDFDKAPTRLEVFGALGKYIEAIEGTDAEERYIKSDWYFDSNLYLRRIEIPGGEVGRPAKIITQSPDNIDQLEIFGQQDYIQTSKPESMSCKEIYRCGERMPDKLTHGALSRHANGVYICEACGTDEALRDWTGNVKPLSDWVLVRVYNGDLRR